MPTTYDDLCTTVDELRVGRPLPESDRALRSARHDAARAALSESRGSTPAGGTATPDVPSEVPAAELTPELARSAVSTHGFLIVRNLVAREVAEELRTGIDRALAAREHDREGDGEWYDPFDDGPPEVAKVRAFARNSGNFLMVDSPRLFRRVMEVFDEAGLRPLVESYLGERAALALLKSSLRRVTRDAPADWHQDGAFLAGDIDSLNVWLALSDCGVDAPGMDIVPRRLDAVVTTGTDGAHFDWTVGHDPAVALAGDRGIITPTFAAGDAILFDHLLLHRTSGSPQTVKPRYAIECWFFPPSRYPEGETPFLY